MISAKLANLIKDHSDDMYKIWLRELRQHPDTASYHKLPEETLRERVFNVYGQLSRWLTTEAYHKEVEEIFTRVGRERYHEGFALSEVIKAQMLTRRILIDFVRHHGLFESTHDLFQAVDLRDSVLQFFDRIMYYTVRGFEEECQLRKQLHH